MSLNEIKIAVEKLDNRLHVLSSAGFNVLIQKGQIQRFTEAGDRAAAKMAQERLVLWRRREREAVQLHEKRRSLLAQLAALQGYPAPSFPAMERHGPPGHLMQGWRKLISQRIRLTGGIL